MFEDSLTFLSLKTTFTANKIENKGKGHIFNLIISRNWFLRHESEMEVVQDSDSKSWANAQ